MSDEKIIKNIEIIIDSREVKLKQLINIDSVIVKSLDMGDIVFKKGDEIILIIERKSIMDLMSSICDGRLREQKARLLNSGIDRDRIMYIIEGNLDSKLTHKVRNIPVSTLISSIINMQFRDNIKVYKTNSLHETANFITKCHQKLKKDLDIFWKYKNQKPISAEKYSSLLKKKKKSNMTPEVWFLHQLSLIPQVSEKIISPVVKHYKSISSLIREYEKLEENERPKMLSNFKYMTSSGKERKLGPRISERI